MKNIEVLRAIENAIKMDKSKVRLSMMTKGSYNPCEDCKDGYCEYCAGSSAYQGLIEMQIFFCQKDGKPCQTTILIKSFYEPTKSGIADHKYAVCSYNCSGQKPEWCFQTLRGAVNAAEEQLVNHGFKVLGYVGHDHRNRHIDSLRH